MVAPIRFLSGRQQQQKIGVQGSTEDQKVLEVIGRVGIGSTIFDPSVDLDIRGDVNISGNLTIGDQQGAALSAESLFISGFSTFVGHSTFQNGVTISGVSTFVGFSTFQSDVHLDSNLNVAGIITASSLDITGEGGTGGQASLDNLRVSGFSTFVGVSTFENGFNVSGVSTFIGNANFDSDVDIDGHTELDDLNVSGVSTFQNKVHLLDDDELHFGGSAGGNGDTTIGHDESNTTIAHTGEGNLQVKVAAGKTFSISKFADSDKIADFDVDGAVRLYYDGSEKLSTTSIGASVSNGAASTATLSGPGTLIIDPAPVGDNGGVLRIKGDLYVDGTQTIVNSSTVEIADKVIGIATTSVSDLLLDGAGIGIGSEGNRKTFLYEYNGSVNPSLKSSENLNVATGKVYQVGETEVLSADTLSVGTGATVHSPTANVLTLGTAGQERIFIDANGNVGVGTNIPVGFSSNTNTTILHAGIVTAVKYFGSGGDLEDLIKEKLEGVTTKFVDSEGTISGIGSELNVVSITIDNSNATVGYITAVGFGSTAIYYFNDVTAVGLTSDANINTSGIITTSSLNVTGDSTFDQNLNITQGLSVSGVLTTTSISGSPAFDGLSVTGVSTLGNVTAGVLTASVIVGDGSGLTGLAGVAAGVTVTDNNATVGTAAILNFGPDLDVTPISSGIVTFSLNDNQSLGILTSTRIESTNADLTNINVGLATITQLGGISTLGIGTIFEIKTDSVDGGRFFVESNVGEIFVITNTITDGSLFSVNDSGGIPLLDIENDNIQLTPFGSGNYVGVGKTNPQAKLDVNGDAVVNGSVGIGTTNPQTKLDVRGNALIDGYVAIGTNTTFLDSKVTIDVGVGTIGLSAVSGFTTTYDGFQSGGLETIYRGLNISNNVASDYNTAVLQLNAINSSGYNNPWYLGAISTPELGRGGQFFIGHRDNAAPNGRAEVLRIGTDGEVGIGTTAPSRTLDVNGDIRIRGALYDSSNSAGSAGVVLSSTGAGVSWTTATTTASGQSILEASASTLYYISASPITSGVSTAGFVESDIVIKDGNLGVGTDDPQAKLHAVGLSSDKFIFDSNNSLQIPSGTEAQKESVGTAVTGQIRFNTTNQQFEGFGVGNNWGSLGGVKDVDGDTYILSELSPGSDEDQLYFYTGGNLSGTISSTTGAVYNVDVGIGTTNPQATLHVIDEFLLSTAGAASTQRITERAYTTNNGSLSWEGSAGQLFSITNNLTSGSIFSVNDVSGVPSIDVDADGRVLLAPYGSNEYVGVGKTNPQAKLDVNGDAVVNGSVGIGTTNPQAKLDVRGNALISGVSTFQNNVEILSTGYLQIPVGLSTDRPTGVGVTLGQIRYNSELSTFEGYGAGNAWGSLGDVKDVDGDTYITAESSAGADEDELTFYTAGTERVGINSLGNVGIGSTQPTAKLDVNGDVVFSGNLNVTGVVTATDFNSTSDAKLKTNVQVIEDPLEKVLQINGVSFNWIKDNKPSMGVIADNIQEVLPELVSDTDPKTVNYNGLIGLLIECVKQQQVEIEELKRKVG